MGHERNKPKREVRKPKKAKAVVPKQGRDADVLQHVSQNQEPSRDRQ